MAVYMIQQDRADIVKERNLNVCENIILNLKMLSEF